MAFKFGLETVLKHRQRREELAQRELAEAQAAVDQCLKQIESMYERGDQVREEILDLQKHGDPSAVSQILEREEFLRGHRIRIEKLRLEARELLIVAEEKHELLIEAAREKKILEKLKEKKHLQYREWLKQLEVKQLDDITMTRAGRKS